jgi:hypothetical protein
VPVTNLPKIGEAFPPGDDGAQWAIVMGLVANDLSRARDELVRAAHHDAPSGYYLRVLIAHLVEGTDYMLSCWDKPWMTPIKAQLGGGALAAKDTLQQAWDEQGALLARLRTTRNATFHYGPMRENMCPALEDYSDKRFDYRYKDNPQHFSMSVVDEIGLQSAMIGLDVPEKDRQQLFCLVDPLVNYLLLICIGAVVAQIQLTDPNISA